MTKLLLRLFVKDSQDTKSPTVRTAVGKLSGMVGILSNLLLFALKLMVGIVSGSVAVVADAMNNLSDAASAIVTLIGFKLAEKPADEEHPYGHARYEYLSGLAVAAMIIVIGFELGKTSVEKILSPEAVSFTVPAMILLLVSIGVKLWLSLFNRNLGRMIDSQALMATSADSRNDVIATSVVVLSAVVQMLFDITLDAWLGLAVALFILYSGATLAKETISPLLGENASPEMQELIIQVVTEEEKVLGYHDLMVHDYGPGQRFASIHVEMDQSADPLLCHELIDNLERKCLHNHNVHLVIHYDPVVIDDPELLRMRDVVLNILQHIDDRITIHDFRMVPGHGQTNLIFDIVLPASIMDQQKSIKLQLDAAIARLESKKYYTVVTFDMASFNG